MRAPRIPIMQPWSLVEKDVYRLQDSCNVYAVRGPAGAWLIINAGTSRPAANLHALGNVNEATVLVTHHFRDHTAGAAEFQRHGARVAAPWFEREHLSGRQPAMRDKQIAFLYDLAWDHYAPIQPLAVDRWMMDYSTEMVAGLSVETIPTPAVTMGAVTYLVTLPNSRRVAFVGELMCAPGRVARVAPLQYNYNDLTGLENVLFSWDRVAAAKPDLILPSLGEPFESEPGVRTKWLENVTRFEAVHPGIAERIRKPSRIVLEEVSPRLYRADGVSAETHYVVSRSGRVLALDYGYDVATVRFPGRLASWTRRPLLHSIAELREKAGLDRIDAVLPTHYHDDHIVGVSLLQRLFGTELWAAENFADLLERPQDFDRPCLWPEPLRVTRRLPLGRPFQWEDVTITLHPMSGHTEYSALIFMEIDGHRIAHTGDQLFFFDPATSQLTSPDRGGVLANHVYRNGCSLDGFVDCIQRLRAFDPELILSGHHRPYRPTAALWDRLSKIGRAHV